MMNLDGDIYIACRHCAKAKSKCDKRVPCSRCVAKNITCEPRSTRRYRNQSSLMQTPQLRAIEPRSPRNDTHHNVLVQARSLTSSGFEKTSTGLQLQTPAASDVSLSNLSTAVLDVSPSSIFNSNNQHSISNPVPLSDAGPMNPQHLSSGQEAGNRASLEFHGVPLANTDFDQPGDIYLGMDDSQNTMDLDMTSSMNPLFFNYPGDILPFDSLLGSWADADPYSNSTFTFDESDADLFSSSLGPANVFLSSSQAPSTIVDHPSFAHTQLANTATVHLQGLKQTLTSEYDWSTGWDVQVDPSPSRRISVEPIQNPSRDKLLAIAQMFFHKARNINSEGDGNSGPTSSSFLILPPPPIMDRFLQFYASGFESYYQLIPGHSLKTGGLMQYGNGNISTVMILLMCAFGATAVPTVGARRLTSGLTEVCRLALLDLIERDFALASDPMMSHSALILLTLGIWSGDKRLMDLAMGHRGMFSAPVIPSF